MEQRKKCHITLEKIGKYIVIQFNRALKMASVPLEINSYQVADAIVGVVRCRECNAELGHPN